MTCCRDNDDNADKRRVALRRFLELELKAGVGLKLYEAEREGSARYLIVADGVVLGAVVTTDGEEYTLGQQLL